MTVPRVTSEDNGLNFYLKNSSLSDEEFLRSVTPGLQSVYLQNCPNLGDATLNALALTPSLSCLNWVSNPSASDEGYRCLGRNSTNLVSLNISGCLAFSSETCRHLLSRLTFLKALDISFCPIGDEAFEELSAPLVYLNLQGCTNITDVTLERLSKISTLKYLYLAHNDGITQEGMKMCRVVRKKNETLLSLGCCK